MLSTYLREEFRRNLLTKFAGLIAAAGHQCIQAAHRSPPVQWRELAGIAWDCHKKPWLG